MKTECWACRCLNDETRDSCQCCRAWLSQVQKEIDKVLIIGISYDNMSTYSLEEEEYSNLKLLPEVGLTKLLEFHKLSINDIDYILMVRKSPLIGFDVIRLEVRQYDEYGECISH
jgi:hypothetical protein